jgi:dTDP-4-amino-4,6-dideoxygalactose transaminase
VVKKVPYIPFRHIHPEMKQEMLHAFEQFYDDQDYIMGSGLRQFEHDYAEYNGVNHAIGVGNGHDALLIALKCLDIGQGDEVIMPAHTFIATALAVVNVGAKVVLVDIDKTLFNINPDEIEQKITKNTRAIIPVHLYGNPCDMGVIQTLVNKHNLYIIEDNAQAHGAEFEGIKTGSIGKLNFASFYPTKNIGALGDGGIITTRSERFAEKAKALRNYGRSSDGRYTDIGVNSRLDEWQARLLSLKLAYLGQWNDERIAIAAKYESGLKNVPDIQMQSTLFNCKNVRHVFPILTEKRNELRTFLLSKGIETLIHYEKPIHMHDSFSFLGHKKGSFLISEQVCTQELSLPIYPGLKGENIDFICRQINSFFK